MKCERCKGLMLEDDFIDMEESEAMWLRAWRCLNCGHATDSVIVANRQRQAILNLHYEEVAEVTFDDVMAPLAA